MSQAFNIESGIKQIDHLLSRPSSTPNEFSTWIINWLVANMDISTYQVRGLASTFFKAAPGIPTVEAVSAGSMVDMATVGPTLSGLSNGKYLAFWGANIGTSSSDVVGLMGLSPNGGTPSDTHAAKGRVTAPPEKLAIIYSRAFDLAGNDDNTLRCKYMRASGVAGSNPQFHNRWLVAVMVSR